MDLQLPHLKDKHRSDFGSNTFFSAHQQRFTDLSLWQFLEVSHEIFRYASIHSQQCGYIERCLKRAFTRMPDSFNFRNLHEISKLMLRALTDSMNFIAVLMHSHRYSDASARNQTCENETIQPKKVRGLRSTRCTCMVWFRGFCFKIPSFLIPCGLKSHSNRRKLCSACMPQLRPSATSRFRGNRASWLLKSAGALAPVYFRCLA